METMYLIIVVFLLGLAVFDLFVGVSNDAVNFLQPAVGARVASFRTIIIIASFGVIVGATMSSGMMDIARHGIMVPANYSFSEVITVFLAVMVANVIILDMFNSLGLPTSSTVSLVFALLGGAFVMTCIKMAGDGSLVYSDLLNTDKALEVIIAIFVSVAISFVFGVVVMWLSRVVFTFNYERSAFWLTGIFGGIAFTVLSYFIFLKGLAGSPYMPADIASYVKTHVPLLLSITFVASSVVMSLLHLMHINVFKLVVLMGTFALAMAFAGNDLVNFIGVPLAGLDSYNEYVAHGGGVAPNAFMMQSLMQSAKTPVLYLVFAGLVMIFAMATSKKAQNVIKTSVDLSRQDEGDEMFGSSRAARAIVRSTQEVGGFLSDILPESFFRWVDTRFAKRSGEIDKAAAFDVVRAAVNLVLASMLITIGTNLKLPLSTTYVTFMVAMGAGLADRAWGRESAVFRVTGVISVIGGWFITAGASFLICALVGLIMHFGGLVAQIGFIGVVVFMMIHSNRKYKAKKEASTRTNVFQLMMRTRDPELVWDMLQRQVTRTQSFVSRFVLNEFNAIVDGFEGQHVKPLRQSTHALRTELDELKRYRKQEMLALKRCPTSIAVDRNTWFHLAANSDQQMVYTLRRMLEPIREHVENGFQPLPQEYIDEFEGVRRGVNDLMKMSEQAISTRRYDNYREILADADRLKDELSVLRKRQLDRMQGDEAKGMFQVSLVYLNLLQETQQFMSNMRHQLRAAKKFME